MWQGANFMVLACLCAETAREALLRNLGIEKGLLLSALIQQRGRGLYSWQSGEGARYPIRWDASRFNSDEISPLYENCYLAVGLVQMRLRQSPAEC
jgi:hypothetical protein